MASTSQVTRETRKRPRDRKKQIISAAADGFYRFGYHNVSMGDIAAAVGITAGALYRHFRSKQELLEAAILACLDEATDAVEQRSPDDLAGVLDGLVTTAMERRDSGVLWNRESRHLDTQQREQVRKRISVVPERLSVVLRAARPDLEADDAELLTWATLSVLTSPSYHDVQLPPERFAAQLRHMAAVVCATQLNGSFPTTNSPVTGDGIGLLPASRKEALIAAATRLFNVHGYHAVSMEDLGAEVGITSASVYNHFATKADLLFATLAQAANALQVDMWRALATAHSPREALDTAFDSYITFALAHSDMVGMLVAELPNLPAHQRHAVRQMQHDYVNELVNLVRADRPALPEPETYLLVHAALTVINDIARTKRLRQRSALADDAHVLAANLLHQGWPQARLIVGATRWESTGHSTEPRNR